MKKAKLYKSKKTVSRHNKVSGDLVGQRFDSDGNRKVVDGKLNQQRIKLMLMHKIWSIRLIIDIKLNLVTESEEMTVGQFAEEVWIKAHRQKKVKNKAQIKTTMKFWKEIGLWDKQD